MKLKLLPKDHCALPSVGEVQELKNFLFFLSAVSADFTKLNTIGEWLKSLHMEQYNANFKTAGYKDLTQVTCLKESDLKEIGVALIGHRNKIYKSIKSMRKHFDNMPEAV